MMSDRGWRGRRGEEKEEGAWEEKRQKGGGEAGKRKGKETQAGFQVPGPLLPLTPITIS